MSQRPRASLGRVLDDLGDSLLELVAGDPAHEGDIGGIVIHDPDDEPVQPPSALVLGVGVRGSDLPALVRDVGQRGAVGLIVRAPVALTDELGDAVKESGLALLGLRRGATWAQLTALLRSLLAEGDLGPTESESIGGLPSGDLFAVANAVGALLDAPVTIEDRSSRVLAFSGRQDEVDPSRVETIIGRQVPEKYAKMLTDLGVFRELYREHRPVVVNPADLGADSISMQRVAIAVRAGDEVLGSIWAAMEGEITPERTAALQDASKLVALHMLRVRAGADVQRRLRTDLVSTALEGGAGARDALSRLGLAGKQVVVLALGLPAHGPGLSDDAERAAGDTSHLERLADALSVHLSASVPTSAVAVVGGIAYALLPVAVGGHGSDFEERAARLAEEFCERLGTRLPAVVGVGCVAVDVSGITESRATATRVLRVLRDGHATRPVARLPDVHTQSLLLELRDLAAARGERPVGPIARLLEYDDRNDSGLAETLEAWLDALGDVRAAAAALFIHPNTLRYRLRRLQEVSGLDLDDPEQRFAAMLQLRILAPR
ncbi:DNA-binding transcriptional regulator, PucR family [Nocardioides terrae]|uniref:DNA-binding transcriptional regulator, PucR family n=1 Tax=Nocardioides terrae TaxID=574651 RepID=A0A1I1NX68_9ACTN|nr:helix-turn-helix domain-containing protein [Nocardioides terrae]SFD02055.1 DNA-binding transcriptional regulator, PucR family [Nocardioides terrae]